MTECRFCGQPCEPEPDDEEICTDCLHVYLAPAESLDRETDRAWAVARAMTFPELARKKRGPKRRLADLRPRD